MTLELDVPVGAASVADRGRWFGLAVLAVGQLIVALDLMVMLIALPTIGHALKMSPDASQWVITAYSLTYGALLLLGGRIADYGGRKRAFVIGVAGFAVASTLGGLASDTVMLLLARGLQGVFAALLMPAGLSLISAMFSDEKERARAFAVYGAVAGSGLALGMVLGGLITQYLSWRWCLLINPPLCALTLLAAFAVLPESAVPGAPRYDVPGTLLGVGAVGALVYGFARVGSDGWGDTFTIAALMIGVVCSVGFVVAEAQTPEALLPLRLLRSVQRSGVLLAVLLLFIGVIGIFLFLIYYMQEVRHYGAAHCGLAMLPYACGVILAAGVLERPLGRLRRYIPITIALTGATAVSTWFAFLGARWSYATHIMPVLFCLGTCVVSAFIASSAGELDDAPENDSGVCSALFNVAQQLALAIGPALLTSIAVQATHDAAHGAVPGPDALVHGYHHGLIAAAVILGFGVVLALVMIRRPSHLREA